jgi:hypothetical protein
MTVTSDFSRQNYDFHESLEMQIQVYIKLIIDLQDLRRRRLLLQDPASRTRHIKISKTDSLISCTHQAM